MTSSITIEAHCPSNVRVHVEIDEGTADEAGQPVTALTVLKDGERCLAHVYGERNVKVREVLVDTDSPPL